MCEQIILAKIHARTATVCKNSSTEIGSPIYENAFHLLRNTFPLIFLLHHLACAKIAGEEDERIVGKLRAIERATGSVDRIAEIFARSAADPPTRSSRVSGSRRLSGNPSSAQQAFRNRGSGCIQARARPTQR